MARNAAATSAIRHCRAVTDMVPARRGLRALAWAAIASAPLLLSLAATWQAWAAFDFAYPLWYRALAIDAHIQHYGPLNHVRPGFQNTTDTERLRLFGEIVDAIHDQPRRLATLQYHLPNGSIIGPLLRPAEIQHLRDVAVLIRMFQWAAIVGGLCALLLAAVAALRRWPLPPLRHFAIGALVPVAGLGASLVLFGPTELFYVLHRWIFPPDDQWFFYYEESLMSMLMKAPDLFAAIAAEWAVTAVIVFAGLLALQRWLHASLPRQRR
ncbi:MAG: DUF1461 domain-containing protein [Nitrococcus sp.]|nr:DUF1461 domain-containing protein [Nitrococcus sp.]